MKMNFKMQMYVLSFLWQLKYSHSVNYYCIQVIISIKKYLAVIYLQCFFCTDICDRKLVQKSLCSLVRPDMWIIYLKNEGGRICLILHEIGLTPNLYLELLSAFLSFKQLFKSVLQLLIVRSSCVYSFSLSLLQ